MARHEEAEGMRSSSSVLGGLFSWISPFRHSSETPDTEHGVPRATEQEDTPSKVPSSASHHPALPTHGIPSTESSSALAHAQKSHNTLPKSQSSMSLAPREMHEPHADPWASPRSVYQPDTSLASNPSPLAHYAPRPAFHMGTPETPTRRTPNTLRGSASPFAPGSGRRHRPIYFGPGTTPHASRFSPRRPGLSASHSLNTLPTADEPKRRKTDASPTAALPVQYAAPSAPATPAHAPVRSRQAPETLERANEALRSVRAAVGEPPRPTRAASTMLSVLETSEPLHPAPPTVPEVVNPYQTRATAPSPRATPRSTRAKALDAARKRASTAPHDADAPPKASLLDMVERTAPSPSPRKSKRLAPEEDKMDTAELDTLEPPKSAWQHKPKKPSPLAVAAEQGMNDSDTPMPAHSDAPTQPSTQAHAPPPNRSPEDVQPSANVANAAPTAPPAQQHAAPAPWAFAPTADAPKPAAPAAFGWGTMPNSHPQTLGTPPAPAPAPGTGAASSAHPPIPEWLRDLPSWAVVKPPWKRTKDNTSAAIKAAEDVPLDELPKFAFHVPAAPAEDMDHVKRLSNASARGERRNDNKTSFSAPCTASSSPLAVNFPFGKLPNESATATGLASTFGKPTDPSKLDLPERPLSKPTTPPATSFSFQPATQKASPSFAFGTPAESTLEKTSKQPAQSTSLNFSFGKPAHGTASGLAFGTSSFGSTQASSSSKPNTSTSSGAPESRAPPAFSFNTSTPSFPFQKTPEATFDAGASTSQTTEARHPSALTMPAQPPPAETAENANDNALTAAGAGEEDEDTEHEVRAKIWKLDEGKWQDMGVTVFRIKKNKETTKSRVLARNAVNGNVVLNFLLYKGLKVTREKTVLSFVGMMDAKPCSLRCKVKTSEAAESLQEALNRHST